MDTVTHLRTQLLTELRTSPEVSVTFTKSDGTIRVMRATLNFGVIPKEDHPKSADWSTTEFFKQPNSDTIRCYDLDKKAWRSFRLDSVIVPTSN
jgi:hypothetical protein